MVEAIVGIVTKLSACGEQGLAADSYRTIRQHPDHLQLSIAIANHS